jgi:hypothetical protein
MTAATGSTNGHVPLVAAPAEEIFDAWQLPGHVPGPTTNWLTLERNGLRVRAPSLDAQELSGLAARLRQRQRDYLWQLRIDQIAELIGWAINRWLDPFSPYLYQAERLISTWTGYPRAAVRKGLGGWLGTLRTENLRRVLDDELGDPSVLDGFQPRNAGVGWTRAVGPELVSHSFAGNVPGLPAQSLVAALLAKSASLGKVASDEPIFAPLFARSLAEVDQRLGECVAVSYWPGDSPASRQSFEQADLVVAYGSEATIDGIRRALPTGRRLIAYGHKLSFGIVGRELLTPANLDEVADRAGYDVVRFDQQGCLSPHLFYVEAGGIVEPRTFAEALAASLATWQVRMPRGRLDSDERARAAALRREHRFRAATTGGTVFDDDSQEWAVLFDTNPTFAASCLNRHVWVKPLPDAAELGQLLAPVRRYLQTAGVAFDAPRQVAVAELLADAGLDRVCPIGQMGDPPATWHHDGRFNVLDFLRFTDLEPPLSAGRWEYAHPHAGVLGMDTSEDEA